MAMNRNQFLSLMSEGLREVMVLQYKEVPVKYPQIYQVENSKKRKEDYQGIVPIGMLDEKPEQTGITYADMIEGYSKSFTHTTWAKGMRFSEELIEDELYGVMGKRSKMLARAARLREETQGAKLFNNATTTTYYTGHDGLALLSASHTLAGSPGTTYSNYGASASLTLANLETAFNAIRRFVGDDNNLIMLEPATLLIPPELEMDATEILKSSGKPYTADNTTNYFTGKLNIVTWKYITDVDRWFVLVPKSDIAPLWFNRVPFSTKIGGDYDTGDIKVAARERFTNGFFDPRFCYGGVPA